MGGVSAVEDADSRMFRSLMEQAESEFKAGRLKGFGELFVNTRRSNPNPQLRRKILADAPSLRAMYLLAGRYGGFLQIHMEMDSDSVEQLGRLLSIEPKTDVIMSHGGVTADVQLMRELMTRHSNIYWELSQKAPPVWNDRKIHRKFFDESGAEPDFLKLIEDFPDRFMIGTDAYCCDYSQMIATYRKGLLARLSPTTLRKVAYENAQRVMKLK
jgi:predicted TIM-barrel fold metal-dependent hydrolase